jgi:cytochrome P450
MDLDADLLHTTDPARRFAAMAELRRNDPVHRIGGPGGPVYLASRAAVAEALPRIDCFGGGVGAADVQPDLQAINGITEPRHGRIRRIVNGMISPHKAAEVRPFLETLCSQRLDLIDSAEGVPVDAMAEYIDHVPSSAICWLTGWDPEDAIRLYRWTVEVCEKAMDMKPGNSGTIAEMVPAFGDYVEARVSARVALDASEWPDDGMARLLSTEVEGERLSPTAVKTQLLFLLGAGSETTRDMMGLLLYELASDPDLYARVRSDRSILSRAIVEALRLCSPTQFMVRRCVRATELDGHPIAEGESVYIGLASANRDEAHWSDPARFDPFRLNASDHLAFGAGPHVCPGAFLVRLETRIAFNALLDRYERIERVGEGPFEPLRTPMFYGPASLPLLFHRAPARV